MFHVIPVPVLVNGTFTAIQPSSPYIIVNLHRDQYYSLSERDMRSCLSINHEVYLCKQGGPLHHKGSLTSACEISFFNHLPAYDKCRTQKSGDGPHWIQLRNPNEWIYALRQETILNVVCGQNTTYLTIRGSGVAKLQKECIMKQQFLTIRGHNIYPSNTRLSYSPLSNLTDAIIPVQGTTLTYPQQFYQRHIADIEVLKQSVEKFRNTLPTGLQNHDIHHTMGHAGVLIAVLIVIFLVINYYLKTRKSKQIPQPTPKPRERAVTCDIPRRQQQQPEIQEDRFSIRIDNN